MAWTLVQHKGVTFTTGTSNWSLTLTSSPTQGNLLIAVIGRNETTSASLTNPTGYTTRAEKVSASNPTGLIRITSKIAGAGESATVQFTDANLNVGSFDVLEFSGNAASGSEFDAASAGAVQGTAGASIQPGSLTPAGPSELFLAGVFNDNTPTADAVDSGFTLVDTAQVTRGDFAYKIKTDALAENPTFSWTSGSNHSAAIQAAFKPSPSNIVQPFNYARQAVPRAATH